MSDVLAKICADKRRHIEAKKSECPLAELEKAIAELPPTRGFCRALVETAANGNLALIAEIKKASPSKGLIRTEFDPPALAQAYQNGGATCLSILTDKPYFQGNDSFLTTARSAVSLPALRKDFTLDPYQLFEARVIGADAILLIMAALCDSDANSLASLASEIGLDVLVEVHNREELDRALTIDADLIGINNRNLKTLSVDLSVTEELASSVPNDKTIVAESGLYSYADLLRMKDAGASAFLVGESLMRKSDVEQATRALLGLDQAA